jgi:hypothetical protein
MERLRGSRNQTPSTGFRCHQQQWPKGLPTSCVALNCFSLALARSLYEKAAPMPGKQLMGGSLSHSPWCGGAVVERRNK